MRTSPLRTAALSGFALLVTCLLASPATAAPKPSRSLIKRLSAWSKLQQARNEVLTLIRDESRYRKDDKGASAQEDVDKLNAKVAAIWKTLNRTLTADLKKLHRRSRRPQLEALCSAELHQLNDWERALRDHMYNLQVAEANKTLAKKLLKTKRFNTAAFEQVLVTNHYRMSLGLRVLKINLQLGSAAEEHSEEMVRLDYFDHASPNPQRSSPFKRAKLAGFDGMAVGENIAVGYKGPSEVHRGWLTSPGHHRNIVHVGWDCMGVGPKGDMWTQMFGQAERDTTSTASRR
jgi:uncharacterized protein YkwD